MSTGPFIVRHLRPHSKFPDDEGLRIPLSVEAVADLEKAVAVAEGWITTSTAVAKADASTLSGLLNSLATAFVDGRRVPLPGGSEIHVETTTWRKLADEADYDVSNADRDWVPPNARFAAEIVAKWNLRFGVSSLSEGVR